MTRRRLAVSLAIRKSRGKMRYRSIDSAEKALLAKCRSRKITATGLHGDILGPTARRRTRITDIEWVDIRGRAGEDARTGRLMLVPKAGDEYWHELTFSRAEVLAEFPVRAEQAPSQIPPSGVVRKAIASGGLKQKADETPPASPEPKTLHSEPATLPESGAAQASGGFERGKHRTPEQIETEIAAVNAFKGTKEDAYRALYTRFSHESSVGMKSLYTREMRKRTQGGKAKKRKGSSRK